jgi:tripartite ATP-independent transporter DctP family solute receptor
MDRNETITNGDDMKTKLKKIAAILGLLAVSTAVLAQDIQERTIKFGHLNNTDHPTSMGVKRFAELVAAKSGGKIKVNEFASSQLGNELQQQSAMMGGVQEMLVASTTSLAGVVKEFGLLDFPFLFSNARQADAMVDGPLGKMLNARLNDKGIVVLGFFDLGFRNVTNSKRPITKGEDLDGLKLRVIPNPVFIETFKTFKANPVPMPFAELYGALENKAVDGQENPYAVILSSKFYEVNKYVSETNHVYATNPIQISKRFWDKLSATEQKLIQDAATEAQNFQRVASREVSSKAVVELKAKGMVFNAISAPEQARMRSAVKAVHEKFAASYDPAVVKLFTFELERVSKL